MAMTVHCDIVSAEEELFSGLVEMVVAHGNMGDIGVLPGHTPLLTDLKPGPVRVAASWKFSRAWSRFSPTRLSVPVILTK